MFELLILYIAELWASCGPGNNAMYLELGMRYEVGICSDRSRLKIMFSTSIEDSFHANHNGFFVKKIALDQIKAIIHDLGSKLQPTAQWTSFESSIHADHKLRCFISHS